MFEEFINEINETNSFNKYFKKTFKTAQIGSIIVYLFFVLSIIIYPDSIYVTIWFLLISWFGLILFSTNHFIYERYMSFIYNKDREISCDIKYIEELLKKHSLINRVVDIRKYLDKFLKPKNIKKINWFTIIFPCTLIIILITNINILYKTIYIIILFVFTISMNKFVNYLDSNMYDEKNRNIKYIYFCLNIIEKNQINIS